MHCELSRKINLVRLKHSELKEAFNKGKIKRQSSNKKHWQSSWQISTGYEESYNIDNQLKKIYEVLKDKVNILKEIKDEYSLTFIVGVVPQIENNETPGMSFEQYILDFVHNVGAIIDIDLYIFS